MNTTKLAGVTHMNGGRFENLFIEGVSKIKGDIDCAEMSVQGVFSVSGDIRCSGPLRIDGTCKAGGSIRAKECDLRGLLNLSGGLETERFAGAASFRIGGSLNAEEIDVNFVYGSEADEILGQSVRIRKEPSVGAAEFIMDLIPWRHKGRMFKCRLIEADLVAIETAEVETVRGQTVIIGPDCKIGTVEYHDSLDIAPGAQVDNTVKL